VDLSSEDIPPVVREPLVVHVSNAFQRKGVDFLLETARIVARVEPAAKFVVIGQDSDGLGVSNTANVEFLGPIYDRARLADYFRRASVFFLPHRFDRSPHVLVEAMSAGVPFVASAQGGSVELAAGGGTGFCIPIGDVDGYARAVLALLQDARLREEMGSRGKALMLEKYNWPAIARRIITLMSRALGSTDCPRASA
jgi:phosphatidylinositol alpha-1,6-mannosyltransferase